MIHVFQLSTFWLLIVLTACRDINDIDRYLDPFDPK